MSCKTVPSKHHHTRRTPFVRPERTIIHLKFATDQRPPWTVQSGATLSIEAVDSKNNPCTLSLEVDWKDLYPSSCVLQGYTVYNGARHRTSLFMNQSGNEADYIVLVPHA